MFIGRATMSRTMAIWAVEPAVIDNEFADVFDHDLQQLEESAAEFFPIFGDKFQTICQALDRGQQFLRCLQRVGIPHHDGQIARLGGKCGFVFQLADDGNF